MGEDHLDLARIHRALGELSGGALGILRFQFHESTSSTNDCVKEAIRAGEEPGLAVLALSQEGGYGRQGRSWASPYGGFYLSLSLSSSRPLEELPSLSPALSLAVRDALDRLMGEGPFDCQTTPEIPLIKWPNDIVCEGGKLCGISLERLAAQLCVGIGVNCFVPAEPCDVGGKNHPVYLAQLMARPDARLKAFATLSPSQYRLLESLVISILGSLNAVLGQWEEHGFVALRDRYESLMTLRGSRVRLETRDGALLAEGVVCGVDEHGQLRVRSSEGTMRSVSSGEVHLSTQEDDVW